MPFKRLQKHEWDHEGVPHYLQRAVDTLNSLLDHEPFGVSVLLETRHLLSEAQADKFMGFHRIIFGGDQDAEGNPISYISGLSVLNSALWEPPFRIFVEVNDTGHYRLFGIYKEFQ